ncbi:MAG TPA: J domain-containing protein, partial [Nitrososphaerales archaeon]|nr:J domain-containing protein [Nitrososphaerales archaeon]
WVFVCGPIIGLFVLLDAWKINLVSENKHLNQTFWALFVWLTSFFGFWIYFLERRSTTRVYNRREDRPKVAHWSSRFYDLLKVSLNRVFFRFRQTTREGTYRDESSKQRTSGERKKSTLDSQIIWAQGVFGLDSDSSKELVRKKYRELMNDYHPDKLGQATDAQRKLVEDKTKEINRAHDILERYFVGGTRSEAPTLFDRVVKGIEEFTPSTVWKNESGYQAELYTVLKKDFPELTVDAQKDSSRSDLVIQDIGIEVKGPTGGGELQILPDECLRYSPHYQNLIFVLFEPEFTELLYKEISDGITRTYPNVKIIRKV